MDELGDGFGCPQHDDDIAVAGALIAIPATGVTVPANATPGFVGTSGTPAPLDDPNPGDSGSDFPTGPLDPKCAQMPSVAVCQGGPYSQGTPTSPFDPVCATMPADAACAGGPYAPQPPAAVPPPPAAPPIDAPPPPEQHLPGPLDRP